MEPVEAKVVEWDFVGAMQAAQQIQFEEEDLTARLALRRDELQRLAKLKDRIIAKVKATKPPLKKSDLKLRGVGGEVTDADENGITAKLMSGKTESLPWNDLGKDATSGLFSWLLIRTVATTGWRVDCSPSPRATPPWQRNSLTRQPPKELTFRPIS